MKSPAPWAAGRILRRRRRRDEEKLKRKDPLIPSPLEGEGRVRVGKKCFAQKLCSTPHPPCLRQVPSPARGEGKLTYDQIAHRRRRIRDCGRSAGFFYRRRIRSPHCGDGQRGDRDAHEV